MRSFAIFQNRVKMAYQCGVQGYYLSCAPLPWVENIHVEAAILKMRNAFKSLNK